jgi:hypothetical protein
VQVDDEHSRRYRTAMIGRMFVVVHCGSVEGVQYTGYDLSTGIDSQHGMLTW